MIKNIRDNGRAAWKAEFRIFLELYKYDLPLFCDIEIEMDIWEVFWSNYCEVIPEKIATILNSFMTGV